MVPADRLLAFTLAAFLLIVVPGPSVLFVVGRGLTYGRRVAITTVLGNTTGAFLAAAAVAAGIGTIVERSIIVFTVIKLVGAAYLIYLGVKAIRERKSLLATLNLGTTSPPGRRAFREGVTVGLTNPKVAIFFAAVVPQFVDRSAGHVPLQMLLLGLIFSAVALISDSAWGVVAGTARSWLSGSPRRMELIGGTGGLIMIGLGTRLAVTGRHD
ncbi:MAG TPA: LysE family translocator [Mycobacteriales bacterium]|nr:LysE family translocator [Mycobacteriales bacterium]